MAIAAEAVSDASVLPVPAEGLNEVLASWSGQGQLIDALAAVADEQADRDWSATDIRRRAHRVLMAELVEPLASWPQRTSTWIDALPAESLRRWSVESGPRARVDWRDTRRRFGWPPTSFSIRSHERVPDTLLLSTLRWTLNVLQGVRKDAVAVEPSVDAEVRNQLSVALGLLDEVPVSDVIGVMPSRGDLAAVAREGKPWFAVARVAQLLRDVIVSPAEWARRLIVPSEDLRWRLFHLAVLGTMLVHLRERGAHIVSRRPLSASSAAPAYAVTLNGVVWDLWFEAGGVWAYYDACSPYVEATCVLAGASQPIAPDLMLMRSGHQALIIECKYSAASGTVGRVGVPQVLAYSAEARTSLAVDVRACVIAPEGVPHGVSHVETHDGAVGIGPPSCIGDLIDSVLAAADP